MIVPSYPSRVVPLEIFIAQKFDFLGVKFWSRDFFKFWSLPPFDHPCHLKSRVYNPPENFVEHSLEHTYDASLFCLLSHPVDLFGLYVLFFQTTWGYPMVPHGTVFFYKCCLVQCINVHVCIIYKNTKGKFPWEHHLVWIGKNIEVYR